VTNHDYVVERISVAASGGKEDGDAVLSAISNGGRFVAFGTFAGLMRQDDNRMRDVYFYDRHNQQLELLSKFANGDVLGNVVHPGGMRNVAASHPAITPDGRFVAFTTEANLGLDDPASPVWDAFVVDRLDDGEPERVSTLPGHGGAFLPNLSADGRYIAYEAHVGPGPWEGAVHSYRYDRVTETVNALWDDGKNAEPSATWKPWLSADGQQVVYLSKTENLPGAPIYESRLRDDATPANNAAHVLVEDDWSRRAVISGDGKTWSYSRNDDLIIRTAAGTAKKIRSSRWASFSHDGRYVAFSSFNPQLLADADYDEVLVYDQQTNKLGRASATDVGEIAKGEAFYPHIAADGSTVVFTSFAEDMVPGDVNRNSDFFVVELDEGFWSRAEDFVPAAP
jgi:Tol biopolymer transport system component